MKSKDIKVSACIIAYNHEKFIRKCLDGAVNQEIAYDYEIVIGEDKSTDETLKICKEYHEKYPHLIKIIKRSENLGMTGNWLGTLESCSGDFIALCEGDDFWTDPLKLSKQVDFLIENETYALCGSKIQSLDEAGNRNESQGKKFGPVTLEDVLRKNEFTTCTVTLRRKALKIPPFKNFHRFFTVDWPLWCSLLESGDGFNFNYISAQYNIHSEGATSGRNRINTLKNKLEDRLLMIENFPEKKKVIKSYGSKIILHYIWKVLSGKKSYFQAVLKNRKLVFSYFFS